MRRVRLHPAVRAELRDAARFYEDHRPGKGADFLADFMTKRDYIARYPEGAPVFTDRVRRVGFARFPYGIYYCLRGTELEILAVMHDSRRPRKWSDRI